MGFRFPSKQRVSLLQSRPHLHVPPGKRQQLLQSSGPMHSNRLSADRSHSAPALSQNCLHAGKAAIVVHNDHPNKEKNGQLLRMNNRCTSWYVVYPSSRRASSKKHSSNWCKGCKCHSASLPLSAALGLRQKLGRCLEGQVTPTPCKNCGHIGAPY